MPETTLHAGPGRTSPEAQDLDLDGLRRRLRALQPDRPRSIFQLERGNCAIRLQEVSWGTAALQQESWSCGVRIQVDRSSTNDTFAIVTRAEGDTRWMGSPVERGAVVRIVEPWEAATSGRFKYEKLRLPYALERVEAPGEERVQWAVGIFRAAGSKTY